MSGLVKVFEDVFYPTTFKEDEDANRSKEKVDPSQFEAQVIGLYSAIFKIKRTNFEFLSDYKSELELLAEVDHTSGELTKIKGWLQIISKDKPNRVSTDYADYANANYAEVTLNPIKTKNGLIYLFQGTLEWTPTHVYFHKYGPRPIHCLPVYGIPSGKIIDMKASAFKDSQSLFGADGGVVKIEYQSFDFKTAR